MAKHISKLVNYVKNFKCTLNIWYLTEQEFSCITCLIPIQFPTEKNRLMSSDYPLVIFTLI